MDSINAVITGVIRWMNKHWIISSLLIWLALLAMFMGSLGFKFNSRQAAQDLEVLPTISADGKMVVVLDHIGEETPRLRIKWLDRDEPWLEVPAPKYTDNIRFGLTGYKLLLTHARPGPQGASQLSTWDPSQPAKPSEILYQGTNVSFPVEVNPNQVLVRMCPEPPGEQPCKGGYGLLWTLIEGEKVIPIKETKGLLPFGTPNIIKNQGFYWNYHDSEFTKNGDAASPRRTQIISYGFPGKQKPQFNYKTLDSKSGRMRCDQQAERCLISVLTDERINSLFVYGLKIALGDEVCSLPNIKGYQDHFAVSPDGGFAVAVNARHYQAPRTLYVLNFNKKQCDPMHVQKIDLEEAPK